jgi:hypothetical protein
MRRRQPYGAGWGRTTPQVGKLFQLIKCFLRNSKLPEDFEVERWPDFSAAVNWNRNGSAVNGFRSSAFC